jgi:hypothetical protein
MSWLLTGVSTPFLASSPRVDSLLFNDAISTEDVTEQIKEDKMGGAYITYGRIENYV